MQTPSLRTNSARSSGSFAKTLTVAALVIASALACDRPAPPPPTSPADAAPLAIQASDSAPAAAHAPNAASGARPDTHVAGAASDAAASMAPTYEPVVGDWHEATVDGVLGYEVDGSKWRDGTPSVNLADQAKRLYGDRYAEFLDGVKTFAFFPLAVTSKSIDATAVASTKDEPIVLSVRFFPVAGKIDQAAGIAFGIAPDGSYFGVRANALEDNLLFFKVVKGKRTVIDTVRNVPTPTKTWHTLRIELTPTSKLLRAFVDDQKRFEKKLDAIPVGHVGLWSKADSVVLFDRFELVGPNNAAGSYQ